MSEAENPKLMTVDEVSEATGIPSATVVFHTQKRGAPCHRRGRGFPVLIDLDSYVAWRDENNLTGRRGRPAQVDSPAIESAKLRKELALAERYELQASAIRERTIAADDHLSVIRLMTGAATQRIKRLPRDIAPTLVGLEGGEIQSTLERAVHRVCEDLADGDLYEPMPNH